MVLKWIYDVFCGFLIWVADLLPDVPVPGWLSNVSTWQATLSNFLDGVGSWVPLHLTVTVIAAYLVCLTASVGLKVIRIVASFLTLGGGSAA